MRAHRLSPGAYSAVSTTRTMSLTGLVYTRHRRLVFTTHDRAVFTRDDRGVFTTDDRPVFTTRDRLVFTTGIVRLHSSPTHTGWRSDLWSAYT